MSPRGQGWWSEGGDLAGLRAVIDRVSQGATRIGVDAGFHDGTILHVGELRRNGFRVDPRESACNG